LLALDTNVLVRCILKDDQAQSELAIALLETHLCWIGTTVVLESYWVLTAIAGLSKTDALLALQIVFGQKNVTLDNATAVATALQNALQNNLDFPDALHVALMPSGCAFATFDKKLIAKLPESTHPA
jgi:predicted nucleic acid-binding protein